MSSCIALLGASTEVMTVGGVANQGLAHLLQSERDVTVLNLSTSGGTLSRPGTGFCGASFFAELTRLNGPYRRQLKGLLITAGANDFPVTTWPKVHAALNAIYQWAEARNIKVLVMDLPWRGDQEAAISPIMKMSRDMYRLLRGNSVTARNKPSLIRFAPRAGVLGSAAALAYLPDLVHWNAGGQVLRKSWVQQYADGFLWAAP